MIEQTLILIKPDGVQKQLIGEIIKRFEESNLKIHAIKMIHPDEKLAKKHCKLLSEVPSAIFVIRYLAVEVNAKLQILLSLWDSIFLETTGLS